MSEINLVSIRFGGRCEKHCSIKPCQACENDTLRAALADRDAKLAALEKSDRYIRRLLCVAVATQPYMDDGEASDQEIDYLREPPEAIERKLQERSKKQLDTAMGDIA